jgi:putative acetyltransferase
MGIGALWQRSGMGFAEVKRMYVAEAARGSGLGHRLLERIEDVARASGETVLMLETGTMNAAALKLYERAGFSRRDPFGDYPDHPASVFMEKRLR